MISPQDSDSGHAFKHKYPIFTVKTSLELVIESLCSFRGAAKSLDIFSSCSNIESVSHSAILQWAYRIGFHLISNSEFEKREDRIIIIDHLIQNGTIKCLLIITTTLDKVIASNFSLKHEDVEVVGLEIMVKSDGEAIKKILDETKEKVGSIMQLITDKGPDIHKGCSLFIEENPSTVYTYDVTHAVAAIVKKNLAKDEKFDAFLEKCAETSNKLKQTELCFLLPPVQRTKSLYLNINKFIEWANKVHQYKQKGDFSLVEVKNKDDLEQLEKFENVETANSPCRPINDDKLISTLEMKKKMRNNFAKKRFLDNLGWIEDYSKDLEGYSEISKLTSIVLEQTKTEGINNNSAKTFLETIEIFDIKSERANYVKEEILKYLTIEGAQIPIEKNYLSTSDSIESIFGKQKIFNKRSPDKELGSMLLLIGLSVGNKIKDNTFIKKALESTPFKMVKNWMSKLGKTSRSKKREAFKNEVKVNNDATLNSHEDFLFEVG